LAGILGHTRRRVNASNRTALKLAHGNTSFEAFGTAVHSQPDMGMGVAFTRIEPDYLTVLEKWIGELSGS
jgi:hypothetical protein